MMCVIFIIRFSCFPQQTRDCVDSNCPYNHRGDRVGYAFTGMECGLARLDRRIAGPLCHIINRSYAEAVRSYLGNICVFFLVLSHISTGEMEAVRADPRSIPSKSDSTDRAFVETHNSLHPPLQRFPKFARNEECWFNLLNPCPLFSWISMGFQELKRDSRACAEGTPIDCSNICRPCASAIVYWFGSDLIYLACF
ncbi:phosphoribosylglycinamide formyltransferase 2 [Striga asiatica]|uniref:Phosphoribosylglycinamide formyltransferase 2 n=1 Tax=Striga asiatica TaxID=4170 RepID=A0A5A7R313_STRAF|nr:phosphoribosylglycinamide formyltransferase 2 [Striga asiatica]